MHIVELQIDDALDAISEVAVCGRNGRCRVGKEQRGRAGGAACHPVHLDVLCVWLLSDEIRGKTRTQQSLVRNCYRHRSGSLRNCEACMTKRDRHPSIATFVLRFLSPMTRHSEPLRGFRRSPSAVLGSFDLGSHRSREHRRRSGMGWQRKEHRLIVLLKGDLPSVHIVQNPSLVIFAFPQADRPVRQLIQENANTFSFISDGTDELELRAFRFDRLRYRLRRRCLGGRREGRKIGRSRVADSAVREIAHSGFARGT
jgi:hypothetical protein